MPSYHFRYGFQIFSSWFLLKGLLTKSNANGSDATFNFFCPGIYRAMNKWQKEKWEYGGKEPGRGHNIPHKIKGSIHKLETNDLF